MLGYIDNIEKLTLENRDFRRVLFTGPDSQLVVMRLRPGEEIGLEAHKIDQFLRIEKGVARVALGDIEQEVGDGFAIVVPAGAQHNIVNISVAEDLKLYTLYSAPQHPDGTVHETKAEADAAEAEHHG